MYIRICLIAFVLVFSVAPIAYAQKAKTDGIIVRVDPYSNTNAADLADVIKLEEIGGCFQVLTTTGQTPIPSGWVCLNKKETDYNVTMQMLMQAFASGKRCSFEFETPVSGLYSRITYATCFY